MRREERESEGFKSPQTCFCLCVWRGILLLNSRASLADDTPHMTCFSFFAFFVTLYFWATRGGVVHCL